MSLKKGPVRNPDFVAKNAFTVNSGRGPLSENEDELDSFVVCAYCREEIQRIGPDYLNYCENCCLIEGETTEVGE